MKFITDRRRICHKYSEMYQATGTMRFTTDKLGRFTTGKLGRFTTGTRLIYHRYAADILQVPIRLALVYGRFITDMWEFYHSNRPHTDHSDKGDIRQRHMRILSFNDFRDFSKGSTTTGGSIIV